MTRLCSSTIAVALTIGFLVAQPPPAKAALNFDPVFPRVATIDLGNCKPTCQAASKFSAEIAPSTIIVDGPRRRFYAYQSFDDPTFPQGVAVVDPDRGVQTGWIDLSGTKLANPASTRFTVVGYDEARARMFFAETSERLGCFGGSASVTGCFSTPRFAVVDVAADSPTSTVITIPTVNAAGITSSSQSPPEAFEGDSIAGISYDQARQRLYLLLTGGEAYNNGWDGEIDPKGVSIVAYDGRSLTTASKPLWIYRTRACGSALPDRTGRPYFDIGNDGSFAYLPCRGATGSTVAHGVVRINLVDSSGGDPTANITTEFHPFAGNLDTGFAMGDAAGDRAGVGVTGGGKQRFFVFDARNRAWVGSMLMGGINTGGGGVDSATGRFYVASQNEGIRFVDAAGLPPVLSRPIVLGFDPGGILPELAVDPLTRRVAIAGPRFTTTAGFVRDHLWIYEDQTLAFVPSEPRNPDDETTDIDEVRAEQVSHTGFGSAYGAHAMLVRGVGGVPLAPSVNQGLSGSDKTAPLRLESGDRGLFLSQISRAELSGETDRGAAAAGAAAAALDPATAADLKGKYGYLTGPIGVGGGEGQCEQDTPDGQCLAFDDVVGRAGHLQESTCYDFGNEDDPKQTTEQGSTVSCHRLDNVAASSSASAAPPVGTTDISFSVGHTESRVHTVKVPAGGIKTTSISVARGVVLRLPGLGGLAIGEISAEAVSKAAGRPKSAESRLSTVAKNVRITDATGRVVFSCGITGLDATDGDQGEQCGAGDVALGINRYLSPRVTARGPRPDLRPLIFNSPGGAQAIVAKDLYAYWNDATLNGDAQREVSALDLVVYNDADQPSRLTLQLAGVYAEAQYKIGALKPPVVVDPTKLSVSLLDEAAEPLAGGVFQVRHAATDGLQGLAEALVGTCVTESDGMGDCEFDDLEPGDYVINQTAAPAGYALAEDAEITLEPERHTEVVFTNLRSIAKVAITLTTDEGTPLAGGTFTLLADDGDLVRSARDQPFAECTTGLDGRCGFAEVPLDAYVVHQTAAPPGYLRADDAGFRLDRPGQVADLQFTTGLEAIEGVGGSSDAADDEALPEAESPLEEVAPETANVEEPTESTEVVVLSPPPQPIAEVTLSPLRPRGVVNRLRTLPSDAANFLRRNPRQAVLFGLVWLLLGSPLYLVTRRRSLSLAKVST